MDPEDIRDQILRIIWEKDGPVSLREISDETGLSHRSVSTHLVRLRRAGLVVESGYGYHLTNEGKGTMGFPRVEKEMADRLLRTVSQENAFHFYAGIDQPLGVSSDSLINLCERGKSIDIRSVEFHVKRGDFEAWVHSLGDIELERRLQLIKEANLEGDALRKRLYETVNSRCEELLRGKT